MILWWAVLAVLGLVAAAWLGGGALASWREQRAGLVYELTPRYLGAALRGAAALVALGAVLTGSLALLLAPRGGTPATLSADARVAAGPLARHTVTSAPTPGATPSSGPSLSPSTTPKPAAVAATPAAALTVVSHPHGGQLLQGTLPGLPGRFRVWLPGQYQGRSIPLQAVLVLADDAELDGVFEGLAGAVDSGRANPMVAVIPAASCSPTGTVDPALTGAGLRKAVASRFHVAPDPGGWAVLGLDAGAPCAVATELAAPGSFGAAAGLGGRYDALRVPGAPASGSVRLLLADAGRDTAGLASASKLGAALSARPHTAVRLSSAVRDFSADRERFRLVRVAAGYLTEQLATSRR
ncbi:hypothetical protein ACEZCY_16490 [Streptacidiphilus sp. N1-12]|uniref:Uncharacterized protein n=2 Tax=Streptacidiphilus alkalitolerans TaxID=3342712 RepID=A0ABV6WFR4_9ACTN